MAKVLGIGGLFFKARDPKALADWYGDVLGFQIAGEGGRVYARLGEPGAGYAVWSLFDAASNYLKPSQKDFMLNLVVDDIDAVMANITASGGQQVDSISDYGDLGRFGWFLDPEDNKVELWEQLKTAKDD